MLKTLTQLMGTQVAQAESTNSKLPFDGAASNHPVTHLWHDDQLSPDDALTLSRPKLIERSENLSRNNGWAAGVVQKLVEGLIGTGWTFSSELDFEAIGITKEEGKALRKAIENHWKETIGDIDCRCDAHMKLDGRGIKSAAIKHFLDHGDAFARIRYLPRGSVSNVAIELLHSSCLMQPLGQMETAKFKGGIEYDENGAPIAYHFAKSHPDETLTDLDQVNKTVRIPRNDNDPFKSRRVLHHFVPGDIGEQRGRPLLAPVFQLLKQLSKLLDYEVQNANVRKSMPVFIKSQSSEHLIPALMEDSANLSKVTSQLTEVDAYRHASRKDNTVPVDGAKMVQLGFGDDVYIPGSTGQAGEYEALQGTGISTVASAAGLSKEQATGDYKDLSYSGWKGAMIGVWRGLKVQRAAFATSFVRPWFAAVVEDGIARGVIPVPPHAKPFWQARNAYCKGTWLGPAQGSADNLKDAKAIEIELELGLKTVGEVLADRGTDLRQFLSELKREKELFEDEGVEHPSQRDRVSKSRFEGSEEDEAKGASQ